MTHARLEFSIMSVDPSNSIENAATEELTAADVMTPLSRTCSPFSTVTEAVMIFKEEDSDVVPVVDTGKPLGVVIDRDVALAVADNPDLAQQPVTAIMSKDVPSVAADASLDTVVHTMTTANSRIALVIDASSNLVGIVTWTELAKRLPIDAVTAILDAGETAEVHES
ncbi:CBS domain-containing protein [Paludisphaera borealis]|uniref:Inosine-5'-monophosphate dehydrogenase n=1 Tax=Paludisphaera borealis TaxID=1387353 RepID=A0A1U7CZ94_9BACT|nr:CBS domain-containing protein [Paludisphaera borealis]APW64282.1 Inosine-5'-monophosphate dehydrogenase [Paludisphaera borealis]